MYLIKNVSDYNSMKICPCDIEILLCSFDSIKKKQKNFQIWFIIALKKMIY